MSRAGRFIAIEGLDGSGGTTQVRRLARHLEGHGRTVLTTREPTDGPIGRLIRAALRGDGDAAGLGDTVLPYLFAADRRHHLDTLVLPALNAGHDVITDRYVPSSLAYQALAIGLPAVLQLNDSFPAPDLTVVLEAPAEVCMNRILARGEQRERFEDTETLRRIREAYTAGLAALESRGDPILRIDATRSIDAIAIEVAQAVDALS